MNEKRHNQRKDVKRYPVTQDFGFSLSITSFNNLVHTDHLTRVVDYNFIGIGIESDHPINPGIVWFRENIYGKKCGILMWCRQTGSQYRCGIQFLSLTPAEEEYFRYLTERTSPGAQIRDPDQIITRLNDCFIKR